MDLTTQHYFPSNYLNQEKKSCYLEKWLESSGYSMVERVSGWFF